MQKLSTFGTADTKQSHKQTTHWAHCLHNNVSSNWSIRIKLQNTEKFPWQWKRDHGHTRSPTCIGKIIILIKKIKATRMETWKHTSHPSKETWNKYIRVKHRDCSRIVQPQDLRMTHKQLKWNGRWDRIEDSQWKSSQKLPAGKSHPSASAKNNGWSRAPIGMTKKTCGMLSKLKRWCMSTQTSCVGDLSGLFPSCWLEQPGPPSLPPQLGPANYSETNLCAWKATKP